MYMYIYTSMYPTIYPTKSICGYLDTYYMYSLLQREDRAPPAGRIPSCYLLKPIYIYLSISIDIIYIFE